VTPEARRPPSSHGGENVDDEDLSTRSTLPLAVFVEFLRRLHDGPPQHAAAVRVALAVLQGALDRGDVTQTRAAIDMVRGELNALLESLSTLQETGRRWSGRPSPTHEELAEAAQAARAWEEAQTAPTTTPRHHPE
jgi:hypothetical protein